MITRLTLRSAVSLLALTLFGVLATASIRMDTVSLQIPATSPEFAAASITAGIDIPALTATAGTGSLPLVVVRDPI
jgi:hypothetical protein